MYLVTGASGHLGQLVINNLLEIHKIPASRIIATTRKPETLARHGYSDALHHRRCRPWRSEGYI